MDYTFTVAELPEKMIAGISVETDMQHAQQDCQALWQSFGPRICTELSKHIAIPANADSFGISQMLDSERFRYWAAIEISSAEQLPADLQTMIIPAGLYVTCQVPGLEQLCEAYTAMYEKWPQSQNTYAMNMQGICIERYKNNWQIQDPLEIYGSVVKK